MPRRLLLLYLLVIYSCLLWAGIPGQHPVGYKDAYRLAEKYFASENPTAYSDSMARSGFLQVVAALEKSALDDRMLTDSYTKLGILEMSGSEPRSALLRFRSCDAAVRRSALPDSLLFQPYLYSGSCYYDLYDLDSALYFYKKCESILDHDPRLQESERLYNKIGVLYYETGDYLRSTHYFNKALEIVSAARPADAYLGINYRNNLANSYLKLRRYDDAIRLLQQQLPYNLYRQQLLNNLGNAFLEKGELSRAVVYFRKAGLQSPVTYISMARAWMGLGRYDSAEIWLDRSRALYLRSGSRNKNEDLGVAWKYTGDLALAQGFPRRAIRSYQQAIIQLDRDFNDTLPETNPSAFQGLHSYAPLFDALTGKAKAFLAVGDKDGHSRIEAFHAYESALTLLSTVAKGYYSDEARLFLLEKANTVYQEVVDLGYRLYTGTEDTVWLEKIFNYAEECKAAVLQARLGEPEVEALTGEARQIAVALRKKKAEATRLTLLLASPSGENNGEAIRPQIREAELAISRLQQQLEEFPAYSTRQFQRKHISMQSLKPVMAAKNDALVSYFTAAGRLYIFFVTGRSAGCITGAWDDSLVARIKTLTAGLNNANNDRATLKRLAGETAARLTDPITEKIKDCRHLIIAPYNEIGYIPFEILPAAGGRKLLLEKFAISYAYFVNFLTTPEVGKPDGFRVLAFAPFGEKESGDRILANSAEEVKGLPGEIIIGSSATKDVFLAKMNDYPIIHLATHAIADDSDARRSYIAFYGYNAGSADSGNLLYEPEIGQLSLTSASLVVLSACETGKGRLINGEGIISLSRAFTSAGCKSVITSLWKADDAATSYLVRRLYQYLNKGMDKDRALQLAKIDYLNDSRVEQRYKAPRFWAHLVLFGDRAPVVEKQPPYLLIILALLVATAVFFLVRRKTIRRRNPERDPPPAWPSGV